MRGETCSVAFPAALFICRTALYDIQSMHKPLEHPADRRPTIGITMGDPSGIGPEIVVKALADPAVRSLAKFVVFGMNELLAYAADLAEIEPYWWRVQHDSACSNGDLRHNVVVLDYDEFTLHGQAVAQATRQGGEASLAFIRDAITAAQLEPGTPGRLDAIVTGPICKESWVLAGEKRYPGHTELFQARTHAKRSVMMFSSPQLKVALATVHLPLMHIRNVLSIGKVFDPIDLGHQACVALGIDKPRIAVCGLNPHASEHGMFGEEEERVIEPAIRMAVENGIDAHGPFPADTIFRDAIRGKWDLVVAMYHDQGLIPVKLLAFDESVNVTLGLPIIRTSVDHGTAFDIVGRNRANAEPMKSAIQLAVQMSRVRRAEAEARQGVRSPKSA
ncbi:MAG: 4-hydroxythreonine-4-phosphate dehydrogenase PdxA [Phycisphaera sp.]|nr:4-hydroxythreonine-4-phosphate dehydrogenase PdxA [Phycisphaera sp.]